jgi:hypothetical protein
MTRVIMETTTAVVKNNSSCKEASRTHSYKYWNWSPNSTTPATNKGATVLEMKQASLLLLRPTMMHDRQSSAKLFVVASGSEGRPLSNHARRPSGHSLIDGHVDEHLPTSNNSGGVTAERGQWQG